MSADNEKFHDEIVAFLEGELGPEDSARVRGLIESSEAYRLEYDWLKTVYGRLESAGNAYAARMPKIDIANAVMASIKPDSGQSKRVSFDDERAKRRGSGRRLSWLAVAAAAALLIGFPVYQWMSGNGGATNGVNPTNTQPGPTLTNVKKKPSEEDNKRLAKAKEERDKANEDLKKFAATAPPELINPSTEPIKHDEPTVAKILEARREAGAGGAGMARLTLWASIRKDQALQIAENKETPPQAVVGAADALDSGDAERVLVTAVGMLPNDPHARFALASTLANDPAKAPEAMVQLQAMPDLDQENALPYYLKAKLLLQQGDTAGALDALSQAESKQMATAYTKESAQAREQALLAAGVPADEAKMLSAMTAGVDQNAFLRDLGKSLVDYGQNFANSNDSENAQKLFEAAQRLGQQVQSSSQYSQDQLAGLDIQTQALDALQALYTQNGASNEDIQRLTQQTSDLAISINSLNNVFTQLERLFNTNQGDNIWTKISGLILNEGDMSLFQSLARMGIPLPL